jgi:hypothetical protein
LKPFPVADLEGVLTSVLSEISMSTDDIVTGTSLIDPVNGVNINSEIKEPLGELKQFKSSISIEKHLNRDAVFNLVQDSKNKPDLQAR